MKTATIERAAVFAAVFLSLLLISGFVASTAWNRIAADRFGLPFVSFADGVWAVLCLYCLRVMR